jgi:glycosyltransferase involved in cell wall biosynthesis
LPAEGLVARAFGYANPELAEVAAREPADLFIAYQHNSLPAAVWAARKRRAKVALDAQDLLADCSTEPVELVRSIERRYLKSCVYVSTMSAAAASRLQYTNALARTPIVLLNVPRICERAGVVSPNERRRARPLSLYWFGQTIGKHSRADQILAAMGRLSSPVLLVLRGKPDEAFVAILRQRARDLGIVEQLQIFPRADPSEMVRLAAEHDIMLGTQPGTEPFNQLAIGNKVFTGMMAGLALGLSDTTAHRELLEDASDCGFMFRDGDVEKLATHLNDLVDNVEKLNRMKARAWNLADTRFNWEIESKKLLQVIAQSLVGATVQSAGAG